MLYILSRNITEQRYKEIPAGIAEMEAKRGSFPQA